MMRYGFNFGFSSEAQEHLIIFFEQSAAAGRRVQEVVGHDAAAFFDALMEVDSVPAEDRRQVLNREILEHFSKGGKTMFEWIKKIRESKREYSKNMARAAALPDDYRFVYEKIVAYIWSFAGGTGMDMLKTQYDLIELFEEGAAQGKNVLDVTGTDAASFCDELIRENRLWTDGLRRRLNRTINRRLYRQVR